MAGRTGHQRTRRWAVIAVGACVFLFLMDAFVFRRDARAGWMSRVPLPVVSALSRVMPSDPAVHYALGYCRQQHGDHAGAVSSYQRALALDPGFGFAKAECANALVDAGRYAEARTMTRQALATGDRLASAMVAKARLMAVDGDWANALRSADILLSMAPDTAEAQLVRAQVMEAREDWAEAEATVQRVLKVLPGSAPAHALASRLARRAGRTDDALRHGEEAVRLSPQLAEAQLALGEAILASGPAADVDRAEALVEKALESEPDKPAARLALARVHLRRRDVAGATPLLDEVVRRWPEENEARLLLASASDLQRDAERAARWRREHARWQRFLEAKRPLMRRIYSPAKDPQARFALAQEYERMGLVKEALEQVHEGLRAGPLKEGMDLQERLQKRTARGTGVKSPRPTL